ncbi:MAG: mannose-1-phosphate guanylyltransferase, partial [Saprospiraceae bacterium]
GIFIWRAETVLRAFEQFSPDIYRILDAGRSEYNTDREQTFIDQAYPTTPSISVDYAIMEKATNVYTIPSSFGWSDLGTWASLYAELPGDEQGNVTTSGQVVASNTRDTLIRAPKDKLVVVDGLDDYIVVDEGDVLLIFPKSKEQDIKAVNARISQQYGSQFS